MSNGELIYHTLIDLHKETGDPMKRIVKMMLKICAVLSEYDIDEVYMEKSIMKGGNADTMQKLSNLAGGIMLYCAKNKIRFNHPLPTEWRARIGISQSKKIKREMLKAEAILAVKREYGIEAGDDECEAILLARSAFDLPKLNITEDDLWE